MPIKRVLSKIESILFVPIILTFSKNLRCLNFPVCEQCCQQTNSKNDQKFFESAKMKKLHNFFSHQKCLVTLFCACVSAKFKHLKFFENDKFSQTNSVDSILVMYTNVWMFHKISLLSFSLWFQSKLLCILQHQIIIYVLQVSNKKFAYSRSLLSIGLLSQGSTVRTGLL